MMAWEDINEIIDSLQEAIEEIEERHPSLHTFKVSIVRAIASLRAERASLEAGMSSQDGPTTARPESRRTRYMTRIANERIREEIKAIL